MKRHASFTICLILPLVGLYELSGTIDWRFLISYWAATSALSLVLTWHDKRSAGRGGWRISEKTLHLCEILGGWPAAYLAQQLFRHKTSKRSYRIIFWSIVALHQFLALEWITDWRISRWVASLN